MNSLILAAILSCSKFVQIDQLQVNDYYEARAYCKYTPTPEDKRWSMVFYTDYEMKDYLKSNASKIRLRVSPYCVCKDK